MKSVTEQLANYACYHRDRRNIATHFIGIPLIVIALITLLSRPQVELFGVMISPAVLLVIGAVIYYLLLDYALGVLMALLLGATIVLGGWFATLPTTAWLIWGVGMFIVGWVFQFVGHYFEGRKPAFVDDLVGLAIGPLFVVAEALFMLGFRKQLYAAVEKQVAEKLPNMAKK